MNDKMSQLKAYNWSEVMKNSVRLNQEQKQITYMKQINNIVTA